MNEELQRLKRDYQATEAPPWFAMRVQARLPRRSQRRLAWLPAAAMALLAVLALLLLRPAEPPPTVVAGLGPAPSLAALPRLMAEKPPLRSPSLTQLRSLSTPALPARPQPRSASPDDAGDRRGFLDRPTAIKETQHG